MSTEIKKELKTINDVMIQGYIRNKLVSKIRIIMNIETFLLSKFFGGAFYPRFSKTA